MNTAQGLQEAAAQVSGGVDWKEIVFSVALSLVIGGVLYFLIHQSRLPKDKSSIDLADWLLDHTTNRLSDDKIYKLGAFVFTSTVLIYVTLKNALSEWVFAGYGTLWVLKSVVQAARGAPGPPKTP